MWKAEAISSMIFIIFLRQPQKLTKTFTVDLTFTTYRQIDSFVIFLENINFMANVKMGKDPLLNVIFLSFYAKRFCHLETHWQCLSLSFDKR